jgi:hypothetical protein
MLEAEIAKPDQKSIEKHYSLKKRIEIVRALVKLQMAFNYFLYGSRKLTPENVIELRTKAIEYGVHSSQRNIK